MRRLRMLLIVFAPVAIVSALMVRGRTRATREPEAITLSPAQPEPGDDLTIIEGIGPRVSNVLRAAGINSFDSLAASDVSQLRAILRAEGLGYMDPATWPQQAALAAAGETEDLTALQTRLKGGRRSGSDDLTLIEGIGPRVAAILNEAGISTFARLAETDDGTLRALLRSHSLAYLDPVTWPEQARLAASGHATELKRLQGELKGGRRIP
jgi:DNA-directed RNA polymerase subunit beta'